MAVRSDTAMPLLQQLLMVDRQRDAGLSHSCVLCECTSGGRRAEGSDCGTGETEEKQMSPAIKPPLIYTRAHAQVSQPSAAQNSNSGTGLIIQVQGTQMNQLK